MIDLYFEDTTEPGLSETMSFVIGLDGRQGLAAYSAGVLSVQGTPTGSFNLGPYFVPGGGEQTFTQDRCRVGCLVPPTFDWIATLWRNQTLVGSATILAGQVLGVVELFDEGFTVVDPEYVNGICPVVPDPTIQNPAITIG